MAWIFLMAWREGRSTLGQLFIFILSIAVGIAALVAVNSLQETIRASIDQNAKTLLGADLVLSSRQPLPVDALRLVKDADVEFTQETMFNSMVFFPESENSRLVVVRALEGAFPYYGDMVTEPAMAAKSFRERDEVLLEEALFYQFDLKPGQTARIGQKEFTINGKLIMNAGEVMGSFFEAPRVFIAKRFVDETKLITTGSLRRHKIYIREPSPPRLAALMEKLKPLAEASAFRMESVLDRRETVANRSLNLNKFLNLAGLVVLLMGGIGVASSVHVFVQKKKNTIAVLKCLGATGRQGLLIFTIQAIALGLMGAATGALGGVLLQKLLTGALATLMPIPLPFVFSWSSIGMGLLVGSLASILFALIPLIPIRHVSPLLALRASEGGDDKLAITRGQKLALAILGTSIYFFAAYHLKNSLHALLFTAALGLALALFWAAAGGLMWSLKKYMSPHWPYLLRQGLSNLYRPNNQTNLLLTSIGFGVFLILVIALTRQSLLYKISVSTEGGQPNMGLFDISSALLPQVEELIQDNKMPVLQSVPIVSMRLSSINGASVQDLKTEGRIPSWTLRRQYRSTYRDTLNNNEWLVKGQWHGELPNNGPPYPISLEKNIAEDLNVSVGDRLVFDVAGRPIETVVSSLRKVDWYQIQPTFFVVFPTQALKNAPQFHVLTTHAPTSEESAALQKAAAKKFPEISVIDLRIVLSAVNRFVDILSTAIRFVAMLIIATGFIMLVGALTTSQFQRRQQTALLRTLGASRGQIVGINFIEYGSIGILATLTGLLPAILGSWGLTEFFFKSRFSLHTPSILIVSGAVIVLILAISFLNFRSILNQSPMAVLRDE